MDAANNFKKPHLRSEKLLDIRKEASLLIMDIKKLARLPPFPAILFVLVNIWALISACAFGSFSAYNVFGPIPCDRCSVYTKTCYVLTDAPGQEANAIVYGAIWCSVLQAAAAVPAMLLPARRRRCRRALAYAALVATTAVHCMYGRVLYLVVAAYPRDGLAIAALLAVLIVLVFDLICFLSLNLVVAGDEKRGKQSKRDQ